MFPRTLLYNPWSSDQQYVGPGELYVHPVSMGVLKRFMEKSTTQLGANLLDGIPIREAKFCPPTKEAEHWYYPRTMQWLKPDAVIKEGFVFYTYEDLYLLQFARLVTKDVPVMWWKLGNGIRPVFLASENPR